jgi:hypothetical protein
MNGGLRPKAYSVFMTTAEAKLNNKRFSQGQFMITTIPPIGFLIDFPFGVLMWASLAQFMLLIVLKEDSNFVVLKLLRGLNMPIHMVFQLITPQFVINRLLPLYTALILFIMRYYVFPLILDYEIWNFYQMPLEALITDTKADLGF